MHGCVFPGQFQAAGKPWSFCFPGRFLLCQTSPRLPHECFDKHLRARSIAEDNPPKQKAGQFHFTHVAPPREWHIIIVRCTGGKQRGSRTHEQLKARPGSQPVRGIWKWEGGTDQSTFQRDRGTQGNDCKETLSHSCLFPHCHRDYANELFK